MHRRHLNVPAALAGAALVIAACGGGGDSASDGSSPATDPVSTDVVQTDPPAADPPATDPVATDVGLEPRCAIADGQGGFDDVSCTDPHDAEYAGLVAAPDGIVPDDEDEARLELQFLCADVVGTLVDRPTFSFAMDVEYSSSASPGEPYEGEVECWAQVADAPGALTDSIAETDLATALGEFLPVQDLEIGTCFVNPTEDASNLAVVVPCTDTEANLIFGAVDADEGDYPGEDPLVDDGFIRCDSVGANYEQEIDLLEYTLTIPEELGWTAYGQRTMLCTTSVLDVNWTTGTGDDSGPGDADPQLVEVVAPEGFVFGIGEPVCAIFFDDPDADVAWAAVPCAELHSAELVAVVGPPSGNIPAEAAEATVFFNEICRTFVEDATGSDLLRPGVGIGFSASGTLGGAYEGPVECYASFSAVALVGSFQDGPLEELIGDQVIIADLNSGECFVFAEGTFASGDVVSCGDPDALMFIGTYEAADGPYPGIDALREERAIRCAEVLAESGLVELGEAGDPSTLSGTFPDENPWNIPGRRLVTCDIEPA